MTELPQSGVQVTIEGVLLRLLFDFTQAEPVEGDDRTDIYNCESVDVKGRGYGDIVSAIVNDRYSADQVQAIMANYAEASDSESTITPEKREEYLEEYEAYQGWRKHAKEIAATVVSSL
jgi:hypothetical protein